MKYQFSDHSRERFYERFFGLDINIETAIQNAIPFGGQIGSEYYLLNTEYNIVFPISINYDRKEHWVKTTLTYDQAMGNMSLFCDLIAPKEDIRERVENNRKEAEECNSEPVIEDIPIVPEFIKKIAFEFIESVGFQFPNFKKQREHEKKIKEKVKISKKQFKDLFWPEVGKIVHEYHNKCGRFG